MDMELAQLLVLPQYDILQLEEKMLHSMKFFLAPGHDDFSTIFYKKHRDMVYEKVIKMIKEALNSGHINPTIGETMITLIPKIVCLTFFFRVWIYQSMQCYI